MEILEQEVPEEIVKIRNKFPALVGHKVLWPEMKRLARQGKTNQADQLATDHLANSPRFDVRNRVAIRARILRREFLKFEIEVERQVKDLFVNFYDRMERLILSAAGDDGKIPRWRMRSLVKTIIPHNTQVYLELRTLLANAIRKTVRYGIVVNMKSAQSGLDHMDKLMQESDLLEKPVAQMATSSDIFHTIFTRVQQKRIKQGLFTGKGDQAYTSGSSLSQNIWDQKTVNMIKIRRIISTGITQGRSAVSIARDIKRYTYSTGEPDYKMTVGGQGIYKTAYKNALRVARTETNAAYVGAGNEYAAYKGYQQMWNVSVGKRTEDECDDYNGQVFDPDELAAIYPPHPNAVLSGTTIGSYGILKKMVGADYHGPAVLIKTTQNRNLTIGPNHPVFTRRGMIKACELTKNDELIYDIRTEKSSIVFADPDFKQMPFVEDIFQSFLLISNLPNIPSPSHDFHGDRIFCKGEIQIKKPTGGLLPIFQSNGLENFREIGFMGANMEKIILASNGSGDFSVDGINLSSAGGMSGDSIRGTHFVLLKVHSTHYVEHTGKAFDAETETGIYNSNGFVVSNCSCYFTMVVPEEMP